MALGWRDILYFLMGLIAICLVVSFSAYQLTTYGSVRDALEGIAMQPSQVVGLHEQYDSMVEQFASGGGDTFTFRFGGQSIDVTAYQANGKGESQVIGIVLDKYAENLYNGNVQGSLSMAAGIAGASANAFYFLVSALLFAAFFIILALSYIQRWYETTMDMLKGAGKVILVMGAIAFISFLIMPAVVKSVMWASINTELGRDVVRVIEPRITGALLVNTLIVILFGALLYGAGFLLHMDTGEEEPGATGYPKFISRMKEAARARGTSPGRVPSKPGRRQL
ncbi:hypothetical protein Mtc_1243 [Methanocella conradii HZ254]|uniref:Uncharacterized protein n=1 Tax=Methanocella conradii (strain DSM 24694 / JCM 17849 / CGMCC 1.5162 / HZ254) TaxID=1041930 RepID=H8I8U2_METCZ|nr:hypothetical protein [Methanocella conradii]AFC99996.1 hypothetical protein Mtc_1243 [Methanocella conradii HZ254]MDI6897341.1 hypothetical protein [Methanocella conradii]